MGNYYPEHLSGARLRRVYDLASPRIREYLRAELGHVLDSVGGKNRVLELGCGYGRAMKEIAPHVGTALGCDVSRSSLEYAASYLRGVVNCTLVRMNAGRTGFRDDSFDAVICIQNGISAFAVEPLTLLNEAVRVTRRGGSILCSSYSPRIWDARLEWFRAQSRAGLVGELDEQQSKAGTIVCRDGFRSVTVNGEEFSMLFEKIGQRARIIEVDGSSLFAEVVKEP